MLRDNRVSLAYYIALKGSVLNYEKLNKTDFAQRIQCSRNSLCEHLASLISIGLVRIENERIIFTSVRKLLWDNPYKKIENENGSFKVKRNRILVFKSRTVKEAKLEIRDFALSNQLAKHENFLNHQSKKKIPSVSYQGMGNKKAASFFGLKSHSSGSRHLHSMQNRGIINIEPIYEQLPNYSYSEFIFARENEVIPQHSRFFKGSVFIQKYNKITFKEKVEVVVQEEKIKKVKKKDNKKVIERIRLTSISNLPFVKFEPKKHLSKSMLAKKGFSKKEIKKLFVPQFQTYTFINGGRSTDNFGIMDWKMFQYNHIEVFGKSYKRAGKI